MAPKETALNVTALCEGPLLLKIRDETLKKAKKKKKKKKKKVKNKSDNLASYYGVISAEEPALLALYPSLKEYKASSTRVREGISMTNATVENGNLEKDRLNVTSQGIRYKIQTVDSNDVQRWSDALNAAVRCDKPLNDAHLPNKPTCQVEKGKKGLLGSKSKKGNKDSSDDGYKQMLETPENGAIAVDIDGDGDLDLVLFSQSEANQILVNDGSQDYSAYDQSKTKVAFSIAEGPFEHPVTYDLTNDVLSGFCEFWCSWFSKWKDVVLIHGWLSLPLFWIWGLTMPIVKLLSNPPLIGEALKCSKWIRTDYQVQIIAPFPGDTEADKIHFAKRWYHRSPPAEAQANEAGPGDKVAYLRNRISSHFTYLPEPGHQGKGRMWMEKMYVTRWVYMPAQCCDVYWEGDSETVQVTLTMKKWHPHALVGNVIICLAPENRGMMMSGTFDCWSFLKPVYSFLCSRLMVLYVTQMANALSRYGILQSGGTLDKDPEKGSCC